jgi:aspartate kinase
MSAVKNLVVMKFGGTSVEDAAAIKRTGSIVAGRRERGLETVVVVSAMAKVTNVLIEAGEAASKGEKKSALTISAGLRQRHLETASQLLKPDALEQLKIWLNSKFDVLDELLSGIAAVREITSRTGDQVLAYGERLSSRMIAVYFAQENLNGVHVDARDCIVTNDDHGKAIPQPAAIEVRLHEHVMPLIKENKTVVMGGFIASTPEGVTTTLGRGGSDYTAALVGRGLHASAIEIWTDVNGIMTTDPRICPDALRVKHISFEEAAELAYFGAKVLHPATILPAVQKNIPVYVLNSRNAANEGTRITAVAPRCRSPFKCIAAKKKLTIIDIVSSGMLMSHGYMKAVFDIFDKYKVVIDMVSTSEVSISVTVDSNEHLPEICAELGKIADVKYEGNKALICLVGEDIRGICGMAARVFSAVNHINVRMISQGASEINMSFMIEEQDAEEAIRSLHGVFFADADPEIFDVVARDAAAKIAAPV